MIGVGFLDSEAFPVSEKLFMFRFVMGAPATRVASIWKVLIFELIFISPSYDASSSVLGMNLLFRNLGFFLKTLLSYALVS